jgi:two-component system, cell cycle sensor histidine kinase and response regulator CckA
VPDLFVIDDYRQVYEAVALPVLIIDHETWSILAVNEAALNQYGYDRDEFVGMPVLNVRPPEGRDEARKVMSELPHGFWKAVSVHHCRKDGSLFSADVWSRDTVVDGRPVRIATIHEVTERLQLQRELQQAQKMEVVGRLAGGIAHDFNNALTAIIGGSQLLLEQFRDDPDVGEDLDIILRSAHRVALLTRDLLAFSRQQVLRAEVSSLAEVVERSLPTLERVLDSQIELRPMLDSGSWPVRIDASQLEQVIVNLAVNAQDAMPGGGTLSVATGNASVAPHDASDLTMPPGDYAVLTVRDTGTGMDEITRARVFEPFFTTKPAPEGTGLGLSMAYGIIRQSNGFITVDSAPGAGTTFRIYLPRAGALSVQAAPIHKAAVPGKRTVFVVDGDDGVRRSTCRVLEGLGFTVVAAASGEEALLAMLEAPEQVPDLLLTALDLPGMGGEELADRFEAATSLSGVLFLSGYALDGHADIQEVSGGRRILNKPFSMEALTEAVRLALADLARRAESEATPE